jgi:hypothetical protein
VQLDLLILGLLTREVRLSGACSLGRGHLGTKYAHEWEVHCALEQGERCRAKGKQIF